MFSNKKAFTLLEVVIVIFLFVLLVTTVFQLIDYGLQSSDRSRQEVVAINLAREGMESVYAIRGTNRLRRSGKKDLCRLKRNPLDDGGDQLCENDSRLGTGSYLLSGSEVSGQVSPVLVPVTEPLDLQDGVQTGDLQYSLCTKNNQWYPCPGQIPSSKQGRFFREIVGLGLYSKAGSGVQMNCPTGDAPGCGDGALKEYRFCSRVYYMGQGISKVEMCGLVVNFAE